MCGIFGMVSQKPLKNANTYVSTLLRLSESRGKEACGLVVEDFSNIHILKMPCPATEVMATKAYDDLLMRIGSKVKMMGHTRLVTQGDESNPLNNQPVIRKGMVLVHNGIITNQHTLWEGLKNETPQTALDSELLPLLLHQQMEKGDPVSTAIQKVFSQIQGTASFAIFFQESEELVLATNHGNLFYIHQAADERFFFASERNILQQFGLKHPELKILPSQLLQLAPHSCILTNGKFVKSEPSHKKDKISLTPSLSKSVSMVESTEKHLVKTNSSVGFMGSSVPSSFLAFFQERERFWNALKRCTRCVLPETIPFIHFDEQGICNFCHHYQPIQIKGVEALKNWVKSSTASYQRPEGLVPLSGGRDSSYVLHYLKKELGLKPMAFSYDWGMLTDLARRNQARMCGALGVPHIIISADIRRKREHIRNNIVAWLNRPRLGTVPLFMAGDKKYFFYANALMKQNHLTWSVMGENLLETTRFKTGFCGVPPRFGQKNTYAISALDKMRMLGYYGKEFVMNPAYLNSSLWDTMDAFSSYYLLQHRHINLFDYLPWDESSLEDLLVESYGWETAPDSKSTWRIGDGTAAFYNYLYFIMAGFTENDTFRSNQIREGMLLREIALEKVKNENQPRWNSIQWYFATIGLDWQQVISRVHQIPALILKKDFK